MRVWSGVCTFMVLLVGASSTPLRGGAPEVEPEDLQPGLVARYQSLTERRAALDRIDIKPAFYLGRSSPHPRIPPGPFEVVWTGALLVRDPAPVTFDALVCGEVTIEVDGVRVVEGRGDSETARVRPKQPLKHPPGWYSLKIRYRSLAGRPARLQFWWQGPTFSHEPIPAWHFKHLAVDRSPAVARELLVERGRAAVSRFGCARCHHDAFPGIADSPPGPSLADVRPRLNRAWLLDWLESPATVRPGARMPALFAPGRTGFVERWIIAEHLLGSSSDEKRPAPERAGNHRMGRRAFVALGCATCHFLPDVPRAEQPDPERIALTDLSDRLPPAALAAFLVNPHTRYPDGRMPRLPLSADTARDIAAYLLLWSKPVRTEKHSARPPTAKEIADVSSRLGVRGLAETATALLREKRCAVCHPGLSTEVTVNVPLKSPDGRRGCLSGRSLPRFTLDPPTRKAITAYRAVAADEKHPAPFARRQRLLTHFGCVRCHQRDSDRPPAIEAIGSTLGGAWLQNVPFQRTARLTYPHQKFTRAHLLRAVRDGVAGLRPARYSYRMPAFGSEAEAVVRALAEGDGELPAVADPPSRPPADPTLGPLAGPRLAGFQGYGCVSCHVWNGKMLSGPDPGAVGTDLTRVAGRIRREWFDRYLEDPARIHPRTPMPSIFTRGQPALLRSVLDGDSGKQKEALWGYFALGTKAPSPKPPPPLPVETPAAGEPPLVAQIPLHLPDGKVIESICILYGSHDLIVYDLGAGALHGAWTGAQILRDVQGRLRSFRAAGTAVSPGFRPDPPLQLIGSGKPENVTGRTLHGYDRLSDGVRIRWQAQFPSATVEVNETLRLRADRGKRHLLRELQFRGVPASQALTLGKRVHGGQITASPRYALPAPASPPAVARTALTIPAKIEGSLERPGYRAIAYPRPRAASGEDRIMPGALAVNPKDGRVFVASMKTGEIFVVRDPTGDGRKARFDNYTRGLFQEAFSMLAGPDALYVLHRRNLTRITDTDGDGVADRFDRVAALPHGIADTYDYAYGLARDSSGAFVFTYAPYANARMPGSGGALRLVPGRKPEEIAFGFRNPLGWCSGPEGEIFFTDNQGEWVATNKLCHLEKGRFYGFPNPAQRQHATRPPGKPAVWVPYAWAKSINGVTYDNTGGKFGPFDGQLFLAELMFGGGIVRASLEKVNGRYQGACFPFWGPGLLGPLTLAFDPKGRLWVGGITEPGWMAQPDRGALFRIDYTGRVPFEMKTIRVLRHGFRIVFTAPVSPRTARDPTAYRLESYRYEYTGAYGSPELDRTRVAIERIELAPDGRSVELRTAPLVKDRVYMIEARGVRSAAGETLIHPTGAYTLNEIPAAEPER